MLTFLTFKPLVHRVDTIILASILLIMSVPDEDFFSKNAPNPDTASGWAKTFFC
jgi:hypothetical protein